MNDHVSQPVAALLKEAGWEGETAFIYSRIEGKRWLLKHALLTTTEWLILQKAEWLPAPSIGELRERLTLRDMNVYHCEKVKKPSENSWDFAGWLYTVTASADELASIWLWAQGKEGK